MKLYETPSVQLEEMTDAINASFGGAIPLPDDEF